VSIGKSYSFNQICIKKLLLVPEIIFLIATH
jgi:hypothetical protein